MPLARRVRKTATAVNYFGLMLHEPGYVRVRKFDENQPRDEHGRWSGHATPFRAAGFKHKQTGEVIETGAFHDIMQIPGMNEAAEGTGMDLLDEYHQGFITHDGNFLDRAEAKDYVESGGQKVPDKFGKRLDSTQVSWDPAAREVYANKNKRKDA